MLVEYKDLNNKVILVTGATRGIGKAIVKSLAINKAHVVFNFREGKEEIADTLQKELLELGAIKATGLMFDITNEDQMKDALTSFHKENPPITGLVNNAGISKDQIILRLKKNDIMQTIETNLVGAINLTSILSRQFLKSEGVSIINISSVVGLMGNPSQISYSASKAGLIGFTKSLAKELGSRNIRCNAICPGFINTDMSAALDEKVIENYMNNIPLKRFGESNELANLVNFLLSSASAYITGEVIKIDGGIYI